MLRALLPLGGFLLLVLLLAVGLRLDPREVPSPLIDRPAPEFRLPRLREPEQEFATTDRLGEVWLLNVWASWCVACRAEHPLLLDLAASNALPVYGLNHKDRATDALRWLARHGGDPYRQIAVDRDGRVSIDYGVYGVPETYLIDREGVIRYKQIGPITPAILNETILPLARELSQ
jgi:cytochrome c biogenesis protein CcmG/thiol:disulfide interchange protein DsbE